MEVWIVIHSSFDATEVREVYATEGLAKANLVTRTPSGRRSTALGAHDECCCEVEEWTVVEE